MTSRRSPTKPNPFGPRLTQDQREEILAAFRQGTSIIKLAATYGVSKQAISLLAKRRGVKNEARALMPTAAEVAVMLYRCGLKRHEVPAIVRNVLTDKPVDKRTVSAWQSGKGTPRWEQWQQLVAFCTRQDRAADEQLAHLIAQAKGGRTMLQVARTQKEAERLGWPSVDAHLAVIRRIVERAPKDLRIVPMWSAKTKRPSRSRRS